MAPLELTIEADERVDARGDRGARARRGCPAQRDLASWAKKGIEA
jgi:hypothetical protein